MHSSYASSSQRGHRRTCPEPSAPARRHPRRRRKTSRFDGDKAAVIGPGARGDERGRHRSDRGRGRRPRGTRHPTVADRFPGEGPLAGVATALSYARSGWVLTVTCDLPLLTAATLVRFVDRLDGLALETAVVAAVDGKLEPTLACWPASWATEANRAVRSGERRFRHLLQLGGIEPLEVEAGALLDADDRSTLQVLLGDKGPTARPDMTDVPHTEA